MTIARFFYYGICATWAVVLSAAGYTFDTKGFWVGLAFVLAAYVIGRLVGEES